MFRRSDRTHRAQVRALAIKWLLFVAVLPLLSVAGRIAASWLDDNASAPSFVELFGDGELFVLATVISAASIGDLTFDFLGGRDLATPSGRRVVFVNSCALVTLVASVLFFGLVAYANQARSDAVTQALKTNTQAQTLATRASLEERDLVARREGVLNLYRRALRYQHGRARPGTKAYQLRHQLAEIDGQINAVQRSQQQITSQAIGESKQRLTAAGESVTRGRRRGAWLSIVMYVVSLLVGLLAARMAASARLDGERRLDRLRAVPPDDLAGLRSTDADAAIS